jgi:hypothetical protein
MKTLLDQFIFSMAKAGLFYVKDPASQTQAANLVPVFAAAVELLESLAAPPATPASTTPTTPAV